MHQIAIVGVFALGAVIAAAKGEDYWPPKVILKADGEGIWVVRGLAPRDHQRRSIRQDHPKSDHNGSGGQIPIHRFTVTSDMTQSTGRTSAQELLERIRRARRDDSDPILVAVAGPGAAGKSTLARALQGLAPNEVTVIEFDDFYRPSFSPLPGVELGAGFEWQRLRKQVLEPLRAGRAARYQRYNWDADEMGAWIDVPPHGITVVEGIYSSRAELSHFYDFVIWVDAPADLRLQRGIERDGEAARERWLKEWIPDEEAFIAQDDPVSRADIRVFGFPPS